MTKSVTIQISINCLKGFLLWMHSIGYFFRGGDCEELLSRTSGLHAHTWLFKVDRLQITVAAKNIYLGVVSVHQ